MDLKLKRYLFPENLSVFVIEMFVKLEGHDFMVALEVIYLVSRERKYTGRQIMAQVP